MNVLHIDFTGNGVDRRDFLVKARDQVMEFTGQKMLLDRLLNEIAKNIYDHADGRGSLTIIEWEPEIFEFEVHDFGEERYDLDHCKNHSRLAGNGKNHGAGIGIILQLAKVLKIDLRISTVRGFRYHGVYKKISPSEIGTEDIE